jgi:dimethylsulfone monooxygenase
MAITRAEQLREVSNPLFSDRKLKLGTFSSNLSGGCAISTIDGVLEADWPSTLELARMGDEMGFEALVPVGRWKGFGGVTNFNGAGFESFTWAAGIGASTTRSGVFATSHVPTVHPIMAAKQGAAIDHISSGRFVLNVVTGWNLPEIEMFGVDMLDHDTRYERAAEWLAIIRRLWTEDDEFDFEGRFYKIKKGFLAPKPLQQPHPVIMNAGGSDTGRRFAAKHADVAFVNVTSHDFTEVKARMDAYRSDARDAQGHDIQVWTNCYVVQGETEKEAKDFARHYIDENGDWEAARTLVSTLGINSASFPQEILHEMTRHFIGGWAGFPIIGTKEQIVDTLAALSNAGLDGVLLTWARYEEQMREFKDKTLPLVKQAGLR